MTIDELLRDAMTDEVAAAPPATDGEWSAIEERSTELRRARHQRRLTAVAVGVAAALLIGVIAIGVADRSTRSPHDNLFVGDPTTALDLTTGPQAAADVLPATAPAGDGRSAQPRPWLIARTGRTDGELIVYVLNSEEGGCGVDYEADVQDRSDAVVVTVLAVPKVSPISGATCPAVGIIRRRAVSIQLAGPLDGRRVLDGARTDSSGLTPVDGHSLLVPSALPAGMTAQTESLSDTWSVCYAATSVLCSPRTIAGATVSTIQAESSTAMITALALPVTPTADPLAGEDPVQWLMRNWQASADPAYVQVEVEGRPALIFNRQPLDRLGSSVIVWADSTTLTPATTWFAIGVSDQVGLTGESLIALAESMRPAG